MLQQMLQAQENLTSFEGTAAAKVYIGGQNVLNASVGLTIDRPNHVAVRWLGMTIRPRHGVIFIDPQIFVSQDYTLSVLSTPAQPSRDASAQSDRWIISAVTSGSSQPQLSWVLYVEPDTWLIRRAEVAVGSASPRTANAGASVGTSAGTSTGTSTSVGVGRGVGTNVGTSVGTNAEATWTGCETAIIEADYRQAGYRRWEPVRLWAQGRLVLEEFLPGFLVNLIAGRSDGSTSGEVSDTAPCVILDFVAGRPEGLAKGQSK